MAADAAGKRWTPELMIQIERIGAVQVSPDSRRAAFVVKSALIDDDRSEFRTQIHLADTDGSDARQLTQGEHSCDDPQWSPDGRRIAFITNRSGKKNLWLISPDGGEAVPVTTLDQDVNHFRWSPDGKQIAFTAFDAETDAEKESHRAKNDARVVGAQQKQNRLYVVPVTDLSDIPAPQLLTPADRNIGEELFRSVHAPFDWSTDGTEIAFCHVASTSFNDWPTADLAVVDIAGGAIRTLAASSAAESSPRYSPDGSQIAFVASDDPPTWASRKHLCVIPAAGGDTKPLAETHDDFGRYSELLGWAPQGDGLYFTEAHGTSLRLMRMPLDGPPVAASRATGMAFGGMFLNATRTHVGFGWETNDSPVEAYVAKLDDDWKPTRISRVQSTSLPPTGKTEIIKWKSSDGREIEGLLTHPTHVKPGTKAPLLVVIHGGPMGVFTQTFDGTPSPYPIAAFAEAGFAVIRPNVRGSSGYGGEFRYANYGDWGGGDFQDLMAGVDHLIEQGIADEDRMGVMGWSYGGYMTAWTITQTPRFRAASAGAGVTNLMSFTGTTDIPDFLPDYLRGEFWNDAETFHSRSPLHQVRDVATPTLIQHGEKDERVPIGQSWELYHALKRQGCETEFVIYPRTPHGFEEPRLLLDCMERNLDWFTRKVLP